MTGGPLDRAVGIRGRFRWGSAPGRSSSSRRAEQLVAVVDDATGPVVRLAAAVLAPIVATRARLRDPDGHGIARFALAGAAPSRVSGRSPRRSRPSRRRTRPPPRASSRGSGPVVDEGRDDRVGSGVLDEALGDERESGHRAAVFQQLTVRGDHAVVRDERAPSWSAGIRSPCSSCWCTVSMSVSKITIGAGADLPGDARPVGRLLREAVDLHVATYLAAPEGDRLTRDIHERAATAGEHRGRGREQEAEDPARVRTSSSRRGVSRTCQPSMHEMRMVARFGWGDRRPQ